MRIPQHDPPKLINSSKVHIGLMDFDLNVSESFTYHSTKTLLDFDIVIWDLRRVLSGYQRDSGSSSGTKIRSDLSRRNKDLDAFLKTGGLLVVFSPGATVWETNSRTREASYLHNLLPGKYKVSASEGTKMEFHSANPRLKKFWDSCQELFIYKSILEIEPEKSFLRARGTDKSVAYFEERNGGEILVLPSLLEFPNQQNINSNKSFLKVLEQIEEFYFTGRKKPSERAVPEWAKGITLPGESELVGQMNDLRNQIEQIQNKLGESQGHLERFEDEKGLIYGTGDFLALQVKNALNEIGIEASEGPTGRDDLILKYKDKIGVAEVKGVKGSAAEKHAAQLEKWASNFFLENEVHPKPILIVNAFNDLPPEERKEAPFPNQMIPFSTNRNHCLVTTIQILNMLFEARKDSSRRQQFCDLLFNTVGTITSVSTKLDFK